jgi:hypothetical protein
LLSIAFLLFAGSAIVADRPPLLQWLLFAGSGFFTWLFGAVALTGRLPLGLKERRLATKRERQDYEEGPS